MKKRICIFILAFLFMFDFIDLRCLKVLAAENVTIMQIDKITSEEGFIPITGYFLGRSKELNFMNCSVYIDGITQQDMFMGLNVNVSRPDLKITYSQYKDAENSGFQYGVDSTLLTNGKHKLKIDLAGEIKEIDFNVNNKPKIIEVDKISSEEGVIPITGYFLGRGKILDFMNCDVYIDGINQNNSLMGLNLNIDRPDLKIKYPNYKNTENSGFNYNVNTNNLSNGIHKIKFNFAGDEKEISFNVNNKPKIFNVDDITSDKGIINITGYLLGGGVQLSYLNCNVDVDGQALGTYQLITNITRPELKEKYSLYKNAESSGFKYELDTTILNNGTHKIKFNFAGDIKEVSFNVNNIKKIFEMDNSIVSEGKIDFSGYVLGNANRISSLNSKIYVDDIQTDYYLSDLSSSIKRPELNAMYPLYVGAENNGFKYKLDTTSISNGKHIIKFNFSGVEKSVEVNVDNKNIVPNKGSSNKYIEFDPVVSKEGIIKFTGFGLGNSLGLDFMNCSVYVDNKKMNTLGNLEFNLPRPDLLTKYPIYDSSSNRGFSYDLDSTTLDNGKHTLKIDFQGYIKVIEFDVNNNPKVMEFDKISSEEGIIPISGYFLGRVRSLDFMNCHVSIDGIQQDSILLYFNISRPDLKTKYSQYKDVENSGFNYNINTNNLSNGIHTIKFNFDGYQKEVSFNVNNKKAIIQVESIVEKKQGLLQINGYKLSSFNSTGIFDVKVYIDDILYNNDIFSYTAGIDSADLVNKFSGYKNINNCRFKYLINTTKMINGDHKIKFVWPEVSIEQKIIVNNPEGTKEKDDYDIMFGDDLNLGFEQITASINQIKTGMDQMNAAIDQMNKGIKEMVEGLSVINNVVVDSTKIINEMGKTMDEMVKTMDKMNKTMDEMNRTTSTLNMTLGEVVTIVDKLNTSMEQTITGIDNCNKASEYLIKMNTNASIIMAQRYKDEKEKLEKELKIQEEMQTQYYSKWYNRTWEYLKSSINQVGMGKYSDDVTILGTVGEIGVGIFDLDVVADIRDLSYDVKYWKWSWGNAGEISLDAIGLLPVVGIIKYGDEAGIIIKDGEKFNVKKVKGLGKGAAEAIQFVNKTRTKELLEKMPELIGTTREKLLSKIQNGNLSKVANELYRPGATIGDGGTAASLVDEFTKGASTHLQKAQERAVQLRKIISSNELGLNDLDIAEALLDDLEYAINFFK